MRERESERERARERERMKRQLKGEAERYTGRETAGGRECGRASERERDLRKDKVVWRGNGTGDQGRTQTRLCVLLALLWGLALGIR